MERFRLPIITSGVILLFSCTWFATRINAVPSFARKYQTSCSTCHYAFPMLNAFGKAFNNNGYRYPGNDQEQVKEAPVSLGSEAYKKVWPNAIWPADIPGTSPVSVRAVGRINYLPNGVKEGEESESSLEFPHEIEILAAGTIGEDLSFFGEVELENEDNDIAIAFPFFIQYDFSAPCHLRFGMVSPDPTPDHHRLSVSHYNVTNVRNRTATWRLRDEQAGVSLWGAGNGSGGKGGYKYEVGVVNGQAISDVNSNKDVFGRVTYKFGGLGEVGGTEGQASETSAFYKDNSVRVGAFGYSGKATDADIDEDFRAFGGDVEAWYENFIFNGTVLLMNSKIESSTDRKSMAWYGQGNGVVYPWLIGLLRYEWTDLDTDDDAADPQTNLVVGIAGMVRANSKVTLEYFKPLDDARKDDDKLTIQIEFGI